MGSVSEDYKCPLCGRIGNGGYALDSVGYPICTGGEYACLDRILDKDISPVQCISAAIQGILNSGRSSAQPSRMPTTVYGLIASFLTK